MSAAGRLAYLPWQLRDSAVKALAPALVFALMASPTLLSMRASQPGIDFSTDPAGIQLAATVFQNFAVFSIWIGGLLVMSDIVALDRDRQFYRFLFSKPVVPWQLYLQRFIVGLVAFVAIYALVPVIYSAVVTPVPIAHTVIAVALMGVLLGGLMTLVSALTRRDGFGTVIVYMVTSVLQSASKADALADWMDPIARALPPVAKYADARTLLLQGVMPEAEVLWHIGLYGAGLAAVGLFLVKRLPLAR
jgi:ABC-type polysaccharide/polyol phosphate export permease